MVIIGWICTLLALAGLSVLLGGGTYDGVVFAPNLRGGPEGLEHGRLFLSRANPGRLFRVASPVTQVLLLVATLLAWRHPPCGWMLGGALVAVAAADVITFTFHYPRNRLLFTQPLAEDMAALEAAARQWAPANWVRVALVAAAWLLVLDAFTRLVAPTLTGASS